MASVKIGSLEGILEVPEKAKGIVIFVHGSGSSRFSPRNKFVSEFLNKKGFATLLFDLLTQEEEQEDMISGELRFDISFLASRLEEVIAWTKKNHNLPIALFGASTGAAAALMAAPHVKCIVSRGGRPDLAMEALPNVNAPALLIVGGDDAPVIEMNEEALKKIRCEKKLEIVKGATHLFEEPGTLEKVAELAADWFKKHL